MRVLLYSMDRTGEAALAGLRASGHKASFRNPRHFAGPPDFEECDVALVDGRHPAVIQEHRRRGVPMVCWGHESPFGPMGYPVGVGPLEEPATWGFLGPPLPNAYRNPPPEDPALWWCPGGAVFSPEATRQISRPRLLADLLPQDALKDAPRVFIVGGGPSLAGFDPDLLRGEVVIGVNRAFERFPCGVNVSMDTRFLRWLQNAELPDGQAARRAWNQYGGLKVLAKGPQETVTFPGVHEVPCNPAKQDVAPAPETASLRGLGTCTNSGYAALMLAVALGARDICLLGFDMQGRDGRQAWCHQPHPEVEEDAIYGRYVKQFEAAAPILRELGVKVTTYGPTALKCFPNKKLSGVKARLQFKPDWPQVVGYWTGPAYEAEAREMAALCRFFGLPVELVARPDLGSWDANTRQKAQVVEEALRRHDRPVLYLDADARMRRYPRLFYRFAQKSTPRPDMALGWIDWAALPSSPRQDRELLNAVMWLRPTGKTYEALRYWQDLVVARADTGEFEQRQLEDAIGMVTGLAVREIPMDYNQIHDLMREASDRPVIEQMQASRRLKGAA